MDLRPPTPALRLSSPFGFATRSLLFEGEGRLLLSGDAEGLVYLFDLTSRRVLSLLCPAESVCIPAAPVGLPFGTGPPPFPVAAKNRHSNSSPLLQLQRLASSSKVLLQQKDSRLSLFDLDSQKFAGALKTGAISFCKCACPAAPLDLPLDNSSNSSSSSSSSSGALGAECVAAPIAELESAGVFDLRVNSSGRGTLEVTPPMLAVGVPPSAVRRVFGDGQSMTGAGSLQGVAFAASSSAAGLLLTAYELPSLALWDLRHTKEPLSFTQLGDAKSPPIELLTAGARAWVACVQGELQVMRLAKQISRKSQADGPSNSSSSSSRSNSEGSSCNSRRVGVSLQPVVSAHLFAAPESESLVPRASVPSCCQEAFVDYQQLNTDNLHLTSLAVRPDGLIGACGCPGGAVRLYEGKHLRCLGDLRAHHTTVSAVAWCPGSGLLASADQQGVVVLWDVYRDSYQAKQTPP